MTQALPHERNERCGQRKKTGGDDIITQTAKRRWQKVQQHSGNSGQLGELSKHTVPNKYMKKRVS